MSHQIHAQATVLMSSIQREPVSHQIHAQATVLIDSSFSTYFGAVSLKRLRRFDLLTTDLGHALVVCDLTRYLGQVTDNQCVTKICS